MKYSLGFDLGGTKLAGALCNDRGKILAFQKESIMSLKGDPRKGPGLIVGLMGQMAEKFRAENPKCFKGSSLQGIGLASAGPLDVRKGILIHPSNFSGWKIVPIRDLLEKEMRRRGFRCEVRFQNDAIAAARAEGWVGGAKGLESYAVVTVGTGIGSGVIFRGMPLQSLGMGSEFGHITVQSSAIKSPEDVYPASVEGIASGTGILRRAHAMGFQGNTLEELVGDLEGGETKYQVLFDTAGDALGALCFNLSVGLNVQKILFSGGMIKIKRLFWDRMQARYKLQIETFNPAFKCPLTLAKARNQAGVLGAASLPFH